MSSGEVRRSGPALPWGHYPTGLVPESMLKWLGRMPLTWRLPLAAAAMIFVAAIGTTQLAMRAFATHAERQIDRIGHVYLDGLTAAVLPLVRTENATDLSDALRRALDVRVGINDRRLAVLDADRRVMASAERSGPPFEVAAFPAIRESAEGKIKQLKK